MNDLKIRIIISWVFLLILWPLGFFLTIISINSHPIVSAFAPIFVSGLRKDFREPSEQRKKNIILIFVLGSLIVELFKTYKLLEFLGFYRIIIMIVLMAPALAWFVWDDAKVLAGKRKIAWSI